MAGGSLKPHRYTHHYLVYPASLDTTGCHGRFMAAPCPVHTLRYSHLTLTPRSQLQSTLPRLSTKEKSLPARARSRVQAPVPTKWDAVVGTKLAPIPTNLHARRDTMPLWCYSGLLDRIYHHCYTVARLTGKTDRTESEQTDRV